MPAAQSLASSSPLSAAGIACGCPSPPATSIWRWARIIAGAVLAVNSMAIALALNTADSAPEQAFPGQLRGVEIALLTITAIVLLLVGQPLLLGAWHALRQGRMAVELLFLLTLSGAAGISLQSLITRNGPVYFEVLSILLVVYAFGYELNRSAKQRALDVIASYRASQRVARVRSDARDIWVPADQVSAGQQVVVLPGELVPVDGVLLRTDALMEESSLRGEFFPVPRRAGDTVRAGTSPLDAQIILEAAQSGEHSSLDNLLQAVEGSVLAGSASQRAIDKLTRWFLPVIATVSLGTFFAWNFVAPASQALFHAMAVLLVACPCALGFGTPLAIHTATERLRRLGISIPRASDIETLARVDQVVFDKTGTLSSAGMMLTVLTWRPEFEEQAEYLQPIIAAAEQDVSHPFAQALRNALSATVLAPQTAEQQDAAESGVIGHGGQWIREAMTIIPGKGISATLRAGDQQHLIEIIRAEPRGHSNEVACSDPGVTIFFDGRPAADASFQEDLPANREAAWVALQSDGIQLQLLTGDTAARASRVGIANTHASLDPLSKQALVRAAKQEGACILFVGDGLNDSAAMASSDASIALANGAPLARELASGTWDGRHLSAIPAALRISRQTMQRVRANFIWALSYNAAGMVLAAAGQLHPVSAALLMVASSALITWRALALLEMEAPGNPSADEPDIRAATSVYTKESACA